MLGTSSRSLRDTSESGFHYTLRFKGKARDRRLTDVITPRLDAVTHDSGTYLNERSGTGMGTFMGTFRGGTMRGYMR